MIVRQSVPRVIRRVIEPAVIVQPRVSYFVGGDYRAEAGFRREKHTSDYLEYQQFKQWQARQVAQPEPQSKSSPSPGEPSSVVARWCGQCHSGDEPEGGFTIVPSWNLTDSGAIRAIRALATGKMPPDKQLTGAVRNQILTELLRKPKE